MLPSFNAFCMLFLNPDHKIQNIYTAGFSQYVVFLKGTLHFQYEAQ